MIFQNSFVFVLAFRLTEEAINGNPDARTLSSISRAAFEVDDYWRIVAILHKRFWPCSCSSSMFKAL